MVILNNHVKNVESASWDLLSRSLLAVMGSLFDLFPNTVERLEVRDLAVNLLYSKQLLILSDYNSGVNVQVTLLAALGSRVRTYMV